MKEVCVFIYYKVEVSKEKTRNCNSKCLILLVCRMSLCKIFLHRFESHTHNMSTVNRGVQNTFVLLSAGLIVKRMGVPLKLVAMVNSNDVVHRAVTEGDFSMAANVTQTLAPAIDIQVLQLHSSTHCTVTDQ